jgi:hypothetical protein
VAWVHLAVYFYDLTNLVHRVLSLHAQYVVLALDPEVPFAGAQLCQRSQNLEQMSTSEKIETHVLEQACVVHCIHKMSGRRFLCILVKYYVGEFDSV